MEQARVLGCLLEKETTTPEYYPLTLNALVTACNQSTNRDPVVAFDEATVLEALDHLKRRRFVMQVTLSGARTQKYKHDLTGIFPRLTPGGLALMTVLLLRGIQTAGELRVRTERLHSYPDVEAVESAMQGLINFPDEALAVMIPSGGGRKATAYAHLLCGPVDVSAPVVSLPVRTLVEAEVDWRSKMEAELAALRGEVADLKEALGALKGELGA